ncbi:glycosyltransferase family 4 protein [Actinotignum sanguinis]|uniref:glycosyltransferase family 4 protein n=1 Tax=Actinotignum sanguinis TaxID=1445614 RepID=UPI0019CF554C|nr:glycosyltransferase family 4 protein [Actinotignum sanguinis]MDY5147729.1 glycosyltransferase family 4 protein [Actinotignum sanguinis]
MRILGFGTYNTANHPRVGVLLRGLADHGHTVRELNYPLDTGTAGRVAALASARGALSFGADIARHWWRLVRGARRFRGPHAPDVIVVGYLGHFDVLLARLLFPRTPIVLDHLIFASTTATDRGLNTGIKDRLLRTLDSAAIRASTITVLDTPAHLAHMPEALRARGVVVPVGSPESFFAARSAHPVHTPPRVVFYGLFTPLQGTVTIARALRLVEERGVDLEVTLIGTGQDYAEVREILAGEGAHVRVTWRDWVDAAALPRDIATHDLCLGIFGTSDKAQRVVPNKAYQGMAAGLALITSDTAPQREMLKEAACYVPAGDARALADMLVRLAADPEVVTAARTRAAARADLAFHPAQVVRPLLAALDRVPGRRGTSRSKVPDFGADIHHSGEKSTR